MKTIRLAILALLPLAAFACTQEQPATPDPGKDTSNGSFKAVIAEDGMVWTNESEISVFNGISGTKTTANVLYVTSNANGKNATFTTKVKKVGELENYVAFYPYSGKNTLNPASGLVSFNLPSTQDYVENGYGAMPMAASSTSRDLSFRQCLGVFQISLKGEGSVCSISLEGLNVAGDFTLDPVSLEMTAVSGANKVVYNVSEDGLALSETPTVFNILVPAATYPQLLYTITDAEGNTMTAYDEEVTIERAKATSASATDFVLDGAGTNDLSDEGYANCYNVCAPGTYTFDAVMPDGKGRGSKITGISKAVRTWATSGWWQEEGEASLDKIISEISYEEGVGDKPGVISLTIPKNYDPGNIGVAVVDSTGFIIYSWHIWVTASRVKSVAIGGYEILDRPLGASTLFDANGTNEREIDAGRGMLYQWGRKDPLPGPRKGNSTEDECFTTGSTFVVADTLSAKYIYANFRRIDPTKLKLFEYSNTTQNAARIPMYAIIGIVSIPSYGSWDWKPESDPCPYGYHVWTFAESKAILTAGEISARENMETSNCHFELKGGVVFPRTGYRSLAGSNNGGQIKGCSQDSRNWTSGQASLSNTSQRFWWQLGSSYTGGDETSDVHYLKPTTAGTSGAAFGHAASVRCVKNQ